MQAVDDYSRALLLEPSNATGLHNRAALYERLGRCVMVSVSLHDTDCLTSRSSGLRLGLCRRIGEHS